jgi:hypothetical protein
MVSSVRVPREGRSVVDPLLNEAAAVRAFRTVRQVYYGALGAPAVALVIGQAVLATTPGFDGYLSVTASTAPLLTAASHALGLTSLLTVLFLRRWCFQPHRFGLTGNLTTEAALARLKTYQLLIFACAASPVFLGLAEFFMAGLRPGSLDLVALGMLALVLARPRADQWTATFHQLARLWPEVDPIGFK